MHAIDFPGFGASTKPAQRALRRGLVRAPSCSSSMDALGVDVAHLVGNSMGGRVAIEVATSAPERVTSLSLLAPALAWRRNRPLVRSCACCAPSSPRSHTRCSSAIVRDQVKALFAHPDKIDPELIEIATARLLRAYRSPAARIAFFASLRNIYLDDPFGESGLWTRLEQLIPPALFIWGDHDKLVPAAFERPVAGALPNASRSCSPTAATCR